MVYEAKLKKIGDSKWFLIPFEFIKIYDLDKYIYLLEVTKDGKTISFKRMREDENYVTEEEK